MFIDEISCFLQPKACAPGCSSLNYLFGDAEKKTKTSRVAAASRRHLSVYTGPNPKQQPFPGPPSYSRWSLFVSTTWLVFQRSPWQITTAEGHHGRNAPFLPPLLQINAICFSVKCQFLMELMSWRGWNAHSIPSPHGRQYQYVMLQPCIPQKMDV
jgi:hypothetical protein